MVGRKTKNKSIQYRKKISAYEEEKRKILILKSQLGKFPPPGTPFTMQFHSNKITTMINSVSCECRGPDTPHVHYLLDLDKLWDVAKLRKGIIVKILNQKKGEYIIHLQTPL
ncbi:MAG: hypothetical protein ACTSW4_07210 [Candidatus Ranarchaeia archaeon]